MSVVFHSFCPYAMSPQGLSKRGKFQKKWFKSLAYSSCGSSKLFPVNHKRPTTNNIYSIKFPAHLSNDMNMNGNGLLEIPSWGIRFVTPCALYNVVLQMPLPHIMHHFPIDLAWILQFDITLDKTPPLLPYYCHWKLPKRMMSISYFL